MNCIHTALKSVRPDYSVIIMKAKVSEAGSLTAPAYLAIAQAFNEGKLSTATTNTTLDFPLPAAITSKYVTSVTAVGTSALVGTVTDVMQGTNNTAIDGRQSSTWLHA
jgi:type IV pilus assembly protein PilA